MWSVYSDTTKSKSKTKQTLNLAKLDGIASFREVMGMRPLEEISCWKNKDRIEKLRKKHTLTHEEIAEIKTFDQTLGQVVYKGDYQAIYLDEVQRTDGSVESLEYVELNTKCRYGKFRGSLKNYREATASTEEFENDEEFGHATHLTGFHFHENGNPERITADSENAQNLVNESVRRKKPIMVFKATHEPDSEAASLEQASPRLFRNMPNYLYLIEGAPVMITRNIKDSYGIFNGAKGQFVGPAYLRKEYEVTDYETFLSSAVDENKFKTTKQVQIKLGSGKSLTLPIGTTLSRINGSECTIPT